MPYRLTELERLDLSDNTISDQTMQKLVRLMEQGHLSALKTLKLQRTGISDSALAMLLSYQCEMWSQKKQQELHIRGCILEELDVSDNGLRNASLLKLAAALKAGVGLKKVSMRECHLASYFRYAFEDSWGPEMHGTSHWYGYDERTFAHCLQEVQIPLIRTQLDLCSRPCETTAA
jgi:hypothetical protein